MDVKHMLDILHNPLVAEEISCYHAITNKSKAFLNVVDCRTVVSGKTCATSEKRKTKNCSNL